MFNGQVLPIAKSFKHLGVTIDNRLSWKAHVNYVKTKALKFTNNLLRFAKNNCGLDSRAIEVIFKGATLPTI